MCLCRLLWKMLSICLEWVFFVFLSFFLWVVDVLSQNIGDSSNQCYQIENQNVLDCYLLGILSEVKNDLKMLEVQLDIYRREIESLYEGNQYGIQFFFFISSNY